MPVSFVGNWHVSRETVDQNTGTRILEEFDLQVVEDGAVNVLDGFYSQPGLDVVMNGTTELDGRFWPGTVSLPQQAGATLIGTFLFLLDAGGNFFGGSWTPPAGGNFLWNGSRI